MKSKRPNFLNLKPPLWVKIILIINTSFTLSAKDNILVSDTISFVLNTSNYYISDNNGVIPEIIDTNLHFALLTDLHVSPGNDNEIRLQHIVDEINRCHVDFVVVTGDLTNSGTDAELKAVKVILDKLKFPLLIIPGNHETNWSESAGIKFNELWGNDRFFYRSRGYVLVGLNSGPFMRMGDGHVKEEDLNWLYKILENKLDTHEKLIFFSHYPLSEGLDNWDRVTTILNTFNCRVAFCGHGHQLKLINFDGIPGVMGRSIELRNRSGFGYNLVTCKKDSVFVYEKTHGASPASLFLAFSESSADILYMLPASPKPDFAINNIYPDIRKTFEITDSASVFTGVCLVGDTMLIYGNSIGLVKAIHIGKNAVCWEQSLNGPVYSTPVVASGIVVVGTIDGYIKGFNISTGREEWAVHTGRPVLAEAFCYGHHAYLGGGDKSFYKLDVRTGDIVWQYKSINGSIQGKPALSGKYVIFGAWDRHLYCLDSRSGRLIWQWDNGKPQILFSPGNIVPAISNGKVFLVAPDRYATALDLKTGRQLWRTNAHMVRESMGISPDGKEFYAKLMYDSVVAFSTTSKEYNILWKTDAGFGYDHNPCPLLNQDKLVFLANKNGLLVAVDPQTHRVLWKYKAGISSINKIVFQAPGRIWITLTEGKIVALHYPSIH